MDAYLFLVWHTHFIKCTCNGSKGRGTRRGRATDTAGPRAVEYKKKKKKNTIRTDRPTPGTLALIGDSRASLSRVV
eukprot:7387272-Prymnesium_polylepis.1